MRKFHSIVFLALLAGCPPAIADFADRFAVVYIDDKTEKKYGELPVARGLLAEAILKLKKAGAKGVVVKFFLDLGSDKTSDLKLAAAIEQLPVILQARIKDDEKKPNPLAHRFFLKTDAKTSVEGRSGWVPIPMFAAAAYDIGFVDFHGFPLPMLETYRGKNVKSLLLATLELSYGRQATINPGESIKIGDILIPLNPDSSFNLKIEAQNDHLSIPFHKILESEHWFDRIAGKVVILAYNGPKISGFMTEAGKLGAHELFVRVLQSFINKHTPISGSE